MNRYRDTGHMPKKCRKNTPIIGRYLLFNSVYSLQSNSFMSSLFLQQLSEFLGTFLKIRDFIAWKSCANFPRANAVKQVNPSILYKVPGKGSQDMQRNTTKTNILPLYKMLSKDPEKLQNGSLSKHTLQCQVTITLQTYRGQSTEDVVYQLVCKPA